eukprot:CAMPEP_0197522210 /NCGR_PEP_ID=MMETSP1318-20131121/7381_1 /TAXON_ID=552666 /ORGANISM="Partenskyella glossopodia, Strain RCC365" /LENGTH=224 /DNA_ID=CAMNT_0043074503 /DNA_START=52 /DNA_END=726 /DNA_ORIENTATION=+
MFPRILSRVSSKLRVVPAAGTRRAYCPSAAAAAGHGEGKKWRATTILSIRKDGEVAVVGDGQVSFGDMMLKPNAKKVRVIDNGRVITGFAGATADCLTLLERLETRLEQRPGQLMRACVEMAKGWRTDKYLRHLSAMLVVVDKDVSLTLTGNGDVIEPQDGIIGIGSGGAYATAAARALMDTDLSAKEVALKAMTIAADMCVYTNHNFVVEGFDKDGKGPEAEN